MINVLVNPEAFLRTSMNKRLLRAEGYEPMSDALHSVLSRGMGDKDSFEEVALSSEEFDIKIGYFFTDEVRKNRIKGGKTYGGMESFSAIFDSLVKLNGADFIKTYFEVCFDDAHKEEIRKYASYTTKSKELLSLQRVTKKGFFDRRFSVYKELSNLHGGADVSDISVTRGLLGSGLDLASLKIKRHIQQCLATGKIPLTFTHKKATINKRKRLNLTPIRAFYATGQLIDNIVISYDANRRE